MPETRPDNASTSDDPPSQPIFTWSMRVPFADTDMAGIVHFSNFFRYMENAEHAFYRSLGFSVHPVDAGDDSAVVWPRVQASCDYQKPLRFEEEATIHIRIGELRKRSVRYVFDFHRADEEERLARGTMVVVCARRDPVSGQMKAVEIPAAIRLEIERAMNSGTGAPAG